ncbi:xaa-pro aminopeptidase [Anaeramoeba flamelloides]|uniref:Xaa-pro aminopeptidase n=1 Tax=Anaeramoeba flamelloides TaxID=1746091 RepID=A0AAV8ACQ4_9EUKA|nr:xaa-pro aminopeptidase [Anaeramoeba flamelloides]
MLQELRSKFEELGISAIIVKNSDPHNSEYTPKHYHRRSFISNFTGSNGTALVTKDKAFLWTDSRYFLQAGMQLSSDWKLMKMGTDLSLTKWCAENMQKESVIGIDGVTTSIGEYNNLKESLIQNEITLKILESNPIDELWGEKRPPLELTPVFEHPLEIAGETIDSKLIRIREQMEKKLAESFLISNVSEICWTLNVRGSDVKNNPVVISYLLITQHEVFFFVNKERLKESVLEKLENSKIQILPYDPKSVLEILEQQFKLGKVWIDDSLSSFFVNKLNDDPNLIKGKSPIQEMKAIKNEKEIEGMKIAHRKDAVALIQFLYWFNNKMKNSKEEKLTEYQISEKLIQFRSQQENYLSESFDAIVGAGPNGAIIHYKPEEGESKMIENEMLLIDSGGQYLEGTTDITRTIHLGTPTEYEKKCFTAVLQGHIALASAIFPSTRMDPMVLDFYARQPLWNLGIDYKHGTGHGIGCCLCVHEYPPRITSRHLSDNKIMPGMFVSNEPGFYAEGLFGIRIENIILCKTTLPTMENKLHKETYHKEYQTFETVSLVPFQRDLIDEKMLTQYEKKWINDYYQKIKKEIIPLLKEKEIIQYLEKETEFFEL